MPDLLLYDKLLQFPLFQGMSRNDLAEIVAYTRLGFHKFKATISISSLMEKSES